MPAFVDSFDQRLRRGDLNVVPICREGGRIELARKYRWPAGTCIPLPALTRRWNSWLQLRSNRATEATSSGSQPADGPALSELPRSGGRVK